MFRDPFTVRPVLCLNIVLLIVLAAACQAQAQPGSKPDSSPAADSDSPKTSTPPAGQRVVLKVGDLQITQAAFEQYLSDLEAQQGPADLSRKKLGDNYASMLVLSQQAQANHLETSPEVLRQLAIDRMQILSNAEFARLKAQTTPTPEQIKSYYDTHLDDFQAADIRRIFIWTGQPGAKNQTLTPEKAKQLAADIRQAQKTGGDIDKLIRDTPHGPEEIVADQSPISFRRGELPGKMDQAVFALKEGQWAEFNNGPGSYAFIQLVKRTYVSFQEVSPQIAKKLQNEKLREELAHLKQQTGVWMDESYFASKAPAPEATAGHQEPGEEKSSTERGEK